MFPGCICSAYNCFWENFCNISASKARFNEERLRTNSWVSYLKFPILCIQRRGGAGTEQKGGLYVPKRSPWRYWPRPLLSHSEFPLCIYSYGYCWLKSDREVCVSLQKNRRHFFLYEKHYCQSQRVWCRRMFFNCSHGHIWPSLPSKPAALGT